VFDAATVERAMCSRPAELFDIDRRGLLEAGYYADIVLVDCKADHVISDSDVVSRCGWTPMADVRTSHRVAETWVNGTLVYHDGVFTDAQAAMALRFDR
jgi:dihydroorotase